MIHKPCYGSTELYSNDWVVDVKRTALDQRFVTAVSFVVMFFLLFACLSVLHKNTLADEALPRTTETCVDCHDNMVSTLAGTPHQVMAEDSDDALVTCTDCHIGDSRHWEDDPDEYHMVKMTATAARVEIQVCTTCHMNSHQQNMLEKNVHFTNDVNCSACHQVHGNTRHALLKTEEPDLCLGCHTSVAGQFAQPYRHPVNDGIIKCTECHMSLDQTRRELTFNGTNVCMSCHPEFDGPFPYEHQATVDYSTEEGGCLSCHSPHGSSHPRMLKQPYDPPHFQLCTQCHTIPAGHNQNPMHGTMWAGVPCNDCHTDIHGSYVNRLFLSESLEGQGCFNAGCHQF